MYNALKTQLSELLGISKDALHIHLGVAVFFGVALLLRRRLAGWVPWLALLAAAPVPWPASHGPAA
ncbi:MAG: hypothetical protein J0I48_06310 [Devosia sp.]|uniref:hypothetical protein n=1 Tax=Devosia sp. 66-22 TaxID=1895753 RepID=UPI000926EA35|nr:hypothetical protein [Devosia sp. 66-22]MBN9345809.1 hypothetical protein [Devosia sp.]OJX48715.1 MAG: hypothetical protein BGO81_18740 [Devosia sp. 66-22]